MISSRYRTNSMLESAIIHVSVACAEPERALLRELDLPRGATVQAAIDASGLREMWPAMQVNPDRIGIFARRVTLETELRDGDRVEIYRLLKIDPKEARRRRAETSQQHSVRK